MLLCVVADLVFALLCMVRVMVWCFVKLNWGH